MLHQLSKTLCVLITGIGGVVLAGWLWDVARLKSLVAGLPVMMPNTALLFVLIGAAFGCYLKANRVGKIASQLCAAVVCIIALLTLLEYVTGADLWIDRLLIGNALYQPGEPEYVGRMSPHTAICFMLVGASVLTVDVETKRGVRPAQVLAIVTAVISLVALVGYVYGVMVLYGISPQTGMALHTAFGFVLASAVTLLIHPQSGVMKLLTGKGLGGIVARRLLAAGVLIPLLLGWLSMLGQRAGLYDATVASSLMVVGSSLIFSILIWSGARTLERIDEARRAAEDVKAYLLRRVVETQEQERGRLARELHDQMGQHLAALNLQLELHRREQAHAVTTEATLPRATSSNLPAATSSNLSPKTPALTAPDSTHLAQALELTDNLAREVRTLAWELRPPELDAIGLSAAIERYAQVWEQRTGIKVDVIKLGFEHRPRVSVQLEVAAYRIVQEALTNVVKHACARMVSLILERSTHELRLTIEDDGNGFEVDEAALAQPLAEGIGLIGMRERVAAVNGILIIESAKGIGTTLQISMPVKEFAANEDAW